MLRDSEKLVHILLHVSTRCVTADKYMATLVMVSSNTGEENSANISYAPKQQVRRKTCVSAKSITAPGVCVIGQFLTVTAICHDGSVAGFKLFS